MSLDNRVGRIVGTIDHTLLRADATGSDIDRLCAEALEWQFAAVCVNPYWVPRAAEQLAGSRVAVATVAGFPLGASASRTKAAEARLAMEQGAREIDMVLNVGELRAGQLQHVQADIETVAGPVHAADGCLKVILETSLLTDAEKVAACRAAQAAGADFVKTSTGFSSGGARVADIRLMRETVGSAMGVKASGGVRTLGDTEAMLEAGASRIGTSAGVAIAQAALAREQHR